MKELFPYQKEGVEFLLKKRHSWLADEMGLGKTVQVIEFLNRLDPAPSRVLIVCPLSLKTNWLNEHKTWATYDYPNVTTITHYDALSKDTLQYTGKLWDVVVLDEGHYIKNPQAIRSKIVMRIQATRKIILTGTPLLNRPIELHNGLRWLEVPYLPTRMQFALKYCGAYKNMWGWDFTGASNLDQLRKNLYKTVMLRRVKQDVLTQLPPKRRQIIEFDLDSVTKKVIEKERSQIKSMYGSDNYDLVVRGLEKGELGTFDELSTIRRDTALAKVPLVIDHVNDLLESLPKLGIMAHHKEVIHSLMNAFGSQAVCLTGETPADQRQEIVEKFQTDPSIKVFIGSIRAAGVGLTLTAASHCVFAELDWTPGIVEQAEDRFHRIGQHNPVLIQHLVLSGSIDAHMAKTLVYKQQIIKQTL